MKNALLLKFLSIGALSLLLMIPLAMVRGLVQERQSRARLVEKEIADYAAYPQTITGPFLVLPFRRTDWTSVEREAGEATTTEWVSAETRSAVVLQPERLTVTSSMGTETLKRGIYESKLYNADTAFTSTFRIPSRRELEEEAQPGRRVEYSWGQPFVVLSVTDSRGIRALEGSLDEETLGFLPGTGVSWLDQGLHAAAGVLVADVEREASIALHLQLAGTSQLAITPVGKANSLFLTGNWPHPSFAGRFAPIRREVSDKGFRAEWRTTYWATGINAESISRCEAMGRKCDLFNTEQLGLRLVNPVDQYLLTERTVKYADLFLLVTFSAFFMMEVTKKMKVHPVQYGLVGLALAIFFLLTLSLSEHIAFNVAYWVAAGASIALLGYYVTHILGSWRRGVGFSVLLVGLYGLLFGILQSEDAALLTGSIALFALLGAVMVLTRRINWYAVAAGSGATGGESQA